MADAAPAAEQKPWAGGELLVSGGTHWAKLGRTKDEEELYPNLPTPHRIKSLAGVRIAFVSAGPCAVHVMCGDVDGRLFTWGRNEKGQLGHGDLMQRNVPTVVEALEGKKVIGGAGGRSHSIVFTDEGESFGFGLNNGGQLGVGAVRRKGKEDDVHAKPSKALVEKVTAAACGLDFTMWIADGGHLWSAGNPQYGQTGDGTDHQYNTKDSSIAMAYEPQHTPKAVASLAQKIVTRVACGTNHAVAVDNEGSCYTWGFGGYGRLGHREQKDAHAPKRVEEFKGRISVPPDAVVAAGSTSSFCTTTPTGALYAWGKLKVSGDNWMYPRVLEDLSGWNVRSMACGPNTFAIAADQSVITWGQATNGELGYGAGGKKSSANPGKCPPLDGVHVQQVTCGVGFMCFLADPDSDKVQKMPIFETKAPEAEEVKTPAVDEEGKKRKAGEAAGGAKGKKAAA